MWIGPRKMTTMITDDDWSYKFDYYKQISMVVAFSWLGEDHGCEKRWRKMELHDVFGR